MFKKIKTWIKRKIEDSDKSVIERIEAILNYLFNSFLIAIPFFIISLLFYDFSLKRYFLIVIFFWSFIPYFEYYYVWLREGWK